jgi:exodeoxyribonuclease VII large subunit
MELPQHFTLKQVADSIQKTISERYSRTYWVTAEMYKLNPTRKGHCYPELVQRENDNIVVEMRGTLWKTNYDRIRQRFFDVVKEQIQDGMELLFQVKIVYHPIYNIGLEIIDIDPNYALGALQRERQLTLERLHKEGLLNLNQTRELPLLPKRLAVVSQGDSKGYSDFVSLLNSLPDKYHFDTFLFEATLQGDAAINSIQNALRKIEKVKHLFDAVVIIRGGGGEIGMHCYNNYELSKAVATFPLPVFTGIGHSTNLTVCEMVAFRNGITPSDTAYFFLGIYEALYNEVEKSRAYLPQLIENLLLNSKNDFKANVNRFREMVLSAQKTERHNLEQQTKDFSMLTRRYLDKTVAEVNGVRQMIKPLTASFLEQRRNRQLRLKDQVSLKSIALLQEYSMLIDKERNQLRFSVEQRLSRQNAHLERKETSVKLLDPQNVLKRGYAIVSNSKGVLSEKNKAEPKDVLKIVTAAQEIDAEVSREVRRERGG